MGPRRALGWGSRTGLGERGAPGPPEASTQPSSGGFAPTPPMVGVHPRDWWGPGRGACAHISWERWGILGASLGGGSKMGGALRPEVAEETHLSQAQALPRSPVPVQIPQDGLGSWREHRKLRRRVDTAPLLPPTSPTLRALLGHPSRPGACVTGLPGGYRAQGFPRDARPPMDPQDW